MKGIIFREFLNMVEEKFGEELMDKIIEESNLLSKGAYTTVGTYNHKELFTLVSHLSKHTLIPIDQLLRNFGQRAFAGFTKAYASMFEGVEDGYAFLSFIDKKIHVDVLKLYPEAELPKIEIANSENSEFILTYRSKRKMADFAEGLIIGCMDHFKEKVQIVKKDISEDGSVVEFTITNI